MQLISKKEVPEGIDKCCCTCIHNIRKYNHERGTVCICDKDNHYITYYQSFEMRCRAWKLDPWQLGESDK